MVGSKKEFGVVSMSYSELLVSLKNINVAEESISDFKKIIEKVEAEVASEVLKTVNYPSKKKACLNRLFNINKHLPKAVGILGNQTYFFNNVYGFRFNDLAYSECIEPLKVKYAKYYIKEYSLNPYKDLLDNAKGRLLEPLMLPSIVDLEVNIRVCHKNNRRPIVSVEGCTFNSKYLKDIIILLGSDVQLRMFRDKKMGYFESPVGCALLGVVQTKDKNVTLWCKNGITTEEKTVK